MATHKELITSGKFDEKFKRALLDYYSYGFKNLGFYETKKHQTLSEDWLRLNRVIADYLEWSDYRNEVMFANADSQSMKTNPFHRIYRFCKYKPLTYPAYFLHTMAALSQEFVLRDGVDSLELDDKQRIHLEDIIASHSKMKTSDLLYFYTERLVSIKGTDKNKTPNNWLNDLSLLGLVNCEQNDGEKGGKGDRLWSLPELTMRRILEAGQSVNEDFENHLHSALDFFSKYHLFGEIGTFLLDRIGGDDVSPFRFKHEYFMQSLNDFNIIDLLYAIENKKWCKIRYSHGTAGFETELLCYPLEIRVSNMQGREFLMYYEPFRRSYTALRIEFIDSIELYEDKKVKNILTQKGYHTSSKTVDTDIANARKSIQFSWGVSTTKEQNGNAINVVKPHPVTLQIEYSPETEPYIKNRLLQECRSGVVSELETNPYLCFNVNVSDDVELRPWIRSFYSRIMICEGMDTGDFSLKADVEKIVELLNRDELTAPQTKAQDAQSTKWGIPDDVKTALGNGAKARTHDLLFNEAFSIYYYIIADVFTQLSSGDENTSFTESDIDKIILESFNKFDLRVGQKTEELLPPEIKELLFFGGFMIKTKRPVEGKYELVKNKYGTGFDKKAKTEVAYRSKYKCASGVELYRDIVPLSTLELRWLKTILEDDKIRLFLSELEIHALRYLLGDMDKIVFFDRFHQKSTVFPTILDGIYNHYTLYIKYHTMRDQIKIGEFKPIVLEFSKRNNRFQGLFQECGSNKIYTMNVSRIETAEKTDTSFDYSAAECALLDFQKTNRTSVEVEFYDVRNMVDRILTEFSPWKKLCVYDAETKLYKLKIFYQKQDEVDLVVRLLGYGANLRFVDREHPICKEIQTRMNRQMELIRERQKTLGEREADDDR